MNSLQLIEAMSRIREKLAPCRRPKNIYCIAANEINVVDFGEYPIYIIMNTQKRVFRGEHWVCFYMEKPNEWEFFDSLGQDVSAYNLQTPPGLEKKNTLTVTQRPGSKICGELCLTFLYYRSLGIGCFQEIISCFKGNLISIEKYAHCFLRKYGIIPYNICKCKLFD